LFESDPHKDHLFGFTENYIRVKTAFDAALINQIRKVELTELDSDGIYRIKVVND